MKILTLIPLLIIPTLISCSKVETEPYSEVIVNNFTKACTASGASINYCSCVVNELPKYLTQTDYIKLESDFIATKKLPDKMAEALSKSVSTCSPPRK